MGAKHATLHPLNKDDPRSDAILRFHLKASQIDSYEASFKSAARGADTITKSQFDQIMQISQRPSPEEDDDIAGLGISKRTMFCKIWRLFDVDKDGVMTWPEFLLCACFLSASKSHAMILSYFVIVDADGNGRLSKKEILDVFTKFLATKKRKDKRHGAEGLTYEERKQLQSYTTEFLKIADKNKNGFVELEEFMGAWSLFGDKLDSILSGAKAESLTTN